MIYHIAERQDWDARTDHYVAPSLEREGFIHFSTAGQLHRTAAAVFPGRTDLVLLVVDEDLLGLEAVFEDLAGTGEEFPHVYGPIPVKAVVEADHYHAPNPGI